jgi:hypothetical protein
MIEQKDWPCAAGRVFDSVLFTEPDSDDIGHEKWLSKIATYEKVYVTFNDKDGVLKHSHEERQRRAHALGYGVPDLLTAGVTYLNLSGLVDKAHKVFSKAPKGMFYQVNLCDVLSAILTGAAPDLSLAIADQAGTTRVFKLKSKIDRQYGGFGNVGDDQADDDDKDESGKPDQAQVTSFPSVGV